MQGGEIRCEARDPRESATAGASACVSDRVARHAIVGCGESDRGWGGGALTVSPHKAEMADTYAASGVARVTEDGGGERLPSAPTRQRWRTPSPRAALGVVRVTEDGGRGRHLPSTPTTRKAEMADTFAALGVTRVTEDGGGGAYRQPPQGRDGGHLRRVRCGESDRGWEERLPSTPTGRRWRTPSPHRRAAPPARRADMASWPPAC
eukprot:1179971-Prorocentrum_minimum.AAC.2